MASGKARTMKDKTRKRNRELYSAVNSGMTYKQACAFFNLRMSSVRRIYRRLRRKAQLDIETYIGEQEAQ
jgi:Mor family transcriptional regulator